MKLEANEGVSPQAGGGKRVKRQALDVRTPLVCDVFEAKYCCSFSEPPRPVALGGRVAALFLEPPRLTYEASA